VLAGAFLLGRRRWEGHAAGRETEERPPFGAVAYCGVDWEGDDGVLGEGSIAGLAAEDIAVGSNLEGRAVVRRFLLLVHRG
jgi:hypothetical protein